MSIEIALGILMVFVLVGTVLVKYITATFIARHKEALASEEEKLRTARGYLKTAEAEAGISKRKERTLTRQIERLQKRIENHKTELSALDKK